MSAHLDRGELLLGQQRYDMAEREFRLAVAEDPDSPFPHALLAVCLVEADRSEEATTEAREALRLDPGLPYAHYVMAHVLNHRDLHDAAEHHIREAIQLDPEDADYYALLAGIKIQEKRWKDAVDAAEEGLTIDPEHTRCMNLRAMALVRLGRRAEAGQVIQGALARDPDNAATHANQGWTLLHEGKHKEALEHFREALRLEPNMEWARLGILEALKARSPIYRLFLKYILWMSSLSNQAQWGVIIGLYVLYRFSYGVADKYPAIAPYIRPLQYAYIAFAVLTWIAQPLFNLMLRLDPLGRHALSPDQRRASTRVGVLLLLALVLGITAYATGNSTAFLATIYVAGMIIPVSGTFTAPPGRVRNILLAYTLVIAAVIPAGVALGILLGSSSVAIGAGVVFGIAAITFPIVSNLLRNSPLRR